MRPLKALCRTTARRTSVRRNGILILLLLSVLFASCASLPLVGGKGPAVIAIRNNSGADINEVALREPSRSASGSARFGSISPVPAGVTQVFVRSSDAVALPRTIAVEWTDSTGRSRVKDVSLSAALRSLRGDPNEAIVFEFGPADDIHVLVETLAR